MNPVRCRCHIETAPLLAVVHVDGAAYAIDDTRPRPGAALRGVRRKGCLVGCPLHAASFDLATEEACAI